MPIFQNSISSGKLDLTHPLNVLNLRKQAIKVFSLIIMLWGIYGIGQQVRQIFIIYPTLTQSIPNGHSADFSYQNLLLYTLYVSTINFIATAYGLALLIKPSHLVKTAHLIVALLIALTTYYVNNYVHLSPETIIPNF